MKSVRDSFDLTGKSALITGGAGLLGTRHAEAILEMGGIPILLDLNAEQLEKIKATLHRQFQAPIFTYVCDITNPRHLEDTLAKIEGECPAIDILINNAALNPKVEDGQQQFSRLEHYALESWNKEIQVGLTGAFLCTQLIGSRMAQRKTGVIINIASDLGLIAPNQGLYRKAGVNEAEQPVKPVTYSVIKHGLIGLTRYTATYWAQAGIRCNALAPGGIFNHQDETFIQRVSDLIPMQRLASSDEYKAALVFLASSASSYMTGAILTIDGGRTCW